MQSNSIDARNSRAERRLGAELNWEIVLCARYVTVYRGETLQAVTLPFPVWPWGSFPFPFPLPPISNPASAGSLGVSPSLAGSGVAGLELPACSIDQNRLGLFLGVLPIHGCLQNPAYLSRRLLTGSHTPTQLE